MPAKKQIKKAAKKEKVEFVFINPKTKKRSKMAFMYKPTKVSAAKTEPVFSKTESKLILENQRLRKRIRVLQSEARDNRITIMNGNALVENLNAEITKLKAALVPAVVPPPEFDTISVTFTPPKLNDDAGPTVPATATAT